MQCLQIVLPSTHHVMSAWWEPPDTATHVPVAVVFPTLAEYEQTVTTIARMRKIDLNFRDTDPEADELM